MNVAKIQALVARAAHPNTPAEEARTCGVLLAKAIAAGDVEIADPGAPSHTRRRAGRPASRQNYILARYPGRCIACGGHFPARSIVAWQRGRGCAHYGCVVWRAA